MRDRVVLVDKAVIKRAGAHAAVRRDVLYGYLLYILCLQKLRDRRQQKLPRRALLYHIVPPGSQISRSVNFFVLKRS